MESGEEYITRSFTFRTRHQMFSGLSSYEYCDGRHMWLIWETKEIHRVLWWAGLRERDHLGDLGIDRNIILKWIFKNWDGEVWTGLIWLRIGTGAGRL